MYQIQQDKLNYFEKQIDNPNRKITYKFSLNDEPLEVNQIMDNIVLTTDTGLDQYGVGCALVTQLQMSVKSDVLIIPNDKIAIQVGLDIYNEVTQQWETIYTPLGVFYVDTIEEKGSKKSIKAYDGMFKLNKGYFPTSKHTTTQAIANDIATSNGYKIKGISNVSINNEQLEGKTCLEMLSLVASAIGGHVRISRDGSTIEFIEPTNYGETYDESDYTTPTIDDTTSYNITKLRVNYSDQVTNDEGTVTDEGYYEVGSGTDANTLAISNPLLKGQKSQAQIILDKVKRLNGYKRFDTSMPLADFRLDPMDIITYIKGEKECIVPILYMKMTLSYKGISIETQSPTLAESKSEFSFKGTLSQKVENIYTDIIQVKQLTANKVTTDELEATVAKIEQLYVTKVDADEIYANKAEIGDLVAGSIVVEDLKSQVAQVESLVANKANITDLNAINATINNLKADVAEIDDLISNSIISGIIQSGSISSDLLNIKNGFIKDAMIDSVTASKINSGVINTNNVTIQSSNGNMKLQGNLLQFKDKNGKVRIQIGQDTTGNYTFTLYDATGQGVLINQDGVQSSNAIKDGLIVDSKVSDNANINGSKLNINSVYDEMNKDGSKTLKASKVLLDEQKQTLDVSFKQMTTKQDELEESMSTAITDISVAQGQISQLIQDTTITTSSGSTKLKDAYNSTKSTVDSHTTQIGKMQTTIDANTGEITSTKNEVTTIKADLNEIELGLSSVEKNIGDNYYTKSQTDSQIKATKDSINLGVSQTYETKTNVTSKVNGAISTASSDATTKANNALSSAKSYADTKKSEAITSANNTLNSTIANYYTKAQTDSQIKVAKDSITQSVASTYETKSDVTSKINGVNSSISNLQSRMSSAESKITDTAITNVVKQNFYTKSETDGQITSKGYQTASQVQQTVNNLQLKFTQSGGYNRIRNGIFKNGTSQWSSWGSPTISTKSDTGHSYGKSLVLTTTGTNQGVQQTVSDLCSGKTYTLSAYVYTWAANDCGIQIHCGGNYYASKVPKAGEWQRISVTFKATSTSATVQIGRGGWGANGQHLFTAIQFEEGELSTTYTPHPSEVYDGITTIDKDGINVATSYGAHTQFHSGGMSSYNNSDQRTLGIENGGISFHAWNNNALAAYVTQSSLWGGDQSASGLAISTTKNGAYLALGTSSLSDVNTTLNMDQALTISANDNFQPKGINLWKDTHAHGYGIRQLSHLRLAGSGAIQFDYLNTSPSTIYEAVDGGHSLYVMGGYQTHIGCMDGQGTPKGVIWMQNSTNTHSYTHWNFHNYTMYNMKTATSYANTLSRKVNEVYGVNSNVEGIRYLYKNVELINGKAVRSIPNEFVGCGYDIVSIVCKGKGQAWVEVEEESRFEIQGDCKSVNIEIIIYPSEDVMMISTVQPTEAPALELPDEVVGEEAPLITNETHI